MHLLLVVNRVQSNDYVKVTMEVVVDGAEVALE
jgi:hypothetical protein